MNEETVQRPVDNAPLDLGTEFSINLRSLSDSQTNYTIDQLIAALETTRTLTNLEVDFLFYKPTSENNRRIVEPLCRCISNLRRHNEHHPLCDLKLRPADLRKYGMSEVFEQVMIAAKKCGIRGLRFFRVCSLPVQFIAEFCQDNNNLEVLGVNFVSFSDGRAAMSLPPNRPQDSSVMLALDKLSLDEVLFDNSTASTAFANLIPLMTVRSLVLGDVWASAAAADDDLQTTMRILSEIKTPSVTQLELKRTCRIVHFKTALEAGRSSLVELDVDISYDKDDYTERLELLANFIRRAVQLNSLTFSTDLGWDRRPVTKPSQIFRAVEACATVTRIRMIDDGHFVRDIATRNEELARFLVVPGSYPTDKLLWLMRQFDNCPTGRYMLAGGLPGALSFEKIKSKDSPITE